MCDFSFINFICVRYEMFYKNYNLKICVNRVRRKCMVMGLPSKIHHP